MSVKTIIPDGGLELLRAAPNHKLVYTRAVCGSGSVAGTQLAELTDVADYVMDLSIVDVKPTETAATLRLQLDNSKAPREFQLFQIGILAKLMDGDTEIIGERLLQVMQYDAPDIVRAIPHVSEYVVNTLMGQAETVEGIIDHAAYVSIRQHKEIVDELQAKIAAQQLELDSQNKNIDKERILQLSWTDVTLLNGTTFASTNTHLQYCKVGGIVFLRGGVVFSQNTPYIFAQLPVGFRSAESCFYLSCTSGSGGAPSMMMMSTSGAMTLWGALQGMNLTQGAAHHYCISFIAEQ